MNAPSPETLRRGWCPSTLKPMETGDGWLVRLHPPGARLTPAQFDVLRLENTESAGSSPLNDEHRAGQFICAGCDLPLYDASTKYDSGTGWPSFYAPIKGAVRTKDDPGLFGSRTEVHCRRCGGHLGHVFDDGPAPTGKRYCMNGLSLKFVAA